MNRRDALRRLVALGAVLAPSSRMLLAQKPAEPRPTLWHRDLGRAHKVALADGKPLLIVFGAEWCTFCRKLEQNTLTDAETSRFIGASFVPVYLDLDKDKRVAEALEVTSVPCTVVLSPAAEVLGRARGYADPKRYRRTLDEALETQARIAKAGHSRVTR